MVGPDTRLGADAGAQTVNAQSKNLRGDWQAFLAERGLAEGQNEPQAPGQDSFQIFMGLADIHSPPSDPRWLDERSLAYEQATIDAKSKYASFLQSEVKAGQTQTIFDNKGGGFLMLGITWFGRCRLQAVPEKCLVGIFAENAPTSENSTTIRDPDTNCIDHRFCDFGLVGMIWSPDFQFVALIHALSFCG